jgi:FtsP/CotA-like multicopper oxidase with cupredoxin domain
MNDTKILRTVVITLAALTVASSSGLAAEFYLRADVTTKTMPDGAVIPMWGFALDTAFGADDGTVTVPGPILTVPPGDNTLIIHLKNNLTPARTGLPMGCPVCLVIPGQVAPMTPVRFGATPYPQFEGRIRSLTHETEPNNSAPVDYVWNDFKPGTYVYHSGTHIQCHVQMGLYGGVTKDYAAAPYKLAYPGVIYETAVPVFFSEIDPAFHQAVSSDNYGPDKAMTSTIDYEPKYFLINGEPFVSGQPLLPAGLHGGGTLLRFFNMGLKTRCPLLQGSHMTLIAEDGQPYRYPKEQYAALLAAGKTIDAMVTFPAAGTYPLYDRTLRLTNNTATGGGMLKRLEAAAGNFWPVITTVTATSATILDSETSQLLVATVADPDGPSPLTYSWEVPVGAGTLSDATVADPVFTPAFLSAAQTYTLTVTVSDGSHVDIGTVEVTVKPTPTPESLVINGPATVDEGTTAQYTATAYFSDGTSAAVQPQVWSVNVAQATIDTAGLLTAGAVDADTPATITAEYTANGVIATDTHDITILDVTVPPVEVTIDNLDAGASSTGSWFVSGAANPYGTDSMASLEYGSTYTFTADLVPGTAYAVYAWWTDGGNRYTQVPYEIRSNGTLLDTVVVNQFIGGGQWNPLGIYVFSGPASVTITALTPGGTNSTCADAIRFTPVVVESLEITGPATVNENSTANYDAVAHCAGDLLVPVQPQTWSVDVVQATIDATGLLTAASVEADTPAVVSAQFSLNSTIFIDTHNITLLNSGVPAVEIIVDNLDAGTSSTGSWFVSGAANPWATDSVASLASGSTFTFTAELVPGTAYDVYAWWTGGGNRYTAVPYDIHSGGTLLDTVTVNQFLDGGQWNLLGTYTFDGTATVTIRAVVDWPSSTCADAVRFVPVP